MPCPPSLYASHTGLFVCQGCSWLREQAAPAIHTVAWLSVPRCPDTIPLRVSVHTWPHHRGLSCLPHINAFGSWYALPWLVYFCLQTRHHLPGGLCILPDDSVPSRKPAQEQTHFTHSAPCSSFPAWRTGPTLSNILVFITCANGKEQMKILKLREPAK